MQRNWAGVRSEGVESAIWLGSRKTKDSCSIDLSLTSDDRHLLRTESRCKFAKRSRKRGGRRGCGYIFWLGWCMGFLSKTCLHLSLWVRVRELWDRGMSKWSNWFEPYDFDISETILQQNREGSIKFHEKAIWKWHFDGLATLIGS